MRKAELGVTDDEFGGLGFYCQVYMNFILGKQLDVVSLGGFRLVYP